MTLALKQTKNISELFVLAENEQITLSLNDYFSGDSVSYTINSNPNIALYNSQTFMSQNPYNFIQNPSLPASIQVIPSLLLKYNLNQFLIYGTGQQLILLYLNLESLFISERDSLSITPFTQFQICTLPNKIIILILTIDPDVYSLEIQFIQDHTISLPKFGNLSKLGLDLPLEQLYMSEGVITSTFVVTGYINSTAFAYFYDISNQSTLSPPQVIEIYSNAPRPYQPLLTVTRDKDHFIISPSESKLIRFTISPRGLIYIKNVLFLDIFSTNVTSFQLSCLDQYLLIGIVRGFAVISFDFQQVFIKTGPRFYDRVYVSDSGFRNVILTGDSGNFYLYELGTQFNLIHTASIKIPEESFMWGIFSFYYQNYVFLHGTQQGIMIYNISFLDPELVFNSSEQSVNYTLVAYQASPKQSISQNFTVQRPKEGEVGIIEIVAQPTVFADFANLASVISVPLQNYVIGANLYVDSVSIFIDGNNSFFECDVDVVSNVELSFSFEIENWNYTDIILANQSIVVLYNSTGFAVFNESGQEYAYQDEDLRIIEMLQCYDGYLMYYYSIENSTYYLLFTPTVLLLNTVNIPLVSECLIVKCSPIFIICQNATGIGIYSVVNINEVNERFLTNSELSQNITDLSVASGIFLILVCNFNSLLVIDLENFYISNNFKVMFNETVPLHVNKVISYLFSIYLVSDNNEVYMYTYTFAFEKKLSVLNSETLKLFGTYLVSELNGTLQIIDSSQLVTNSTIAQFSITQSLNFTGTILGTLLALYFLNNDSTISSYQVPNNYNHIIVTININNTDEIDQINYNAEMNISVINEINQQLLSVPLVLNVNGVTIYKNESRIEMIQKTQMKYQCGESAIISVDSIFEGQGLIGTVSNSKYVSLAARFESVLANEVLLPFETYTFSNNYQIYVAAYDCSIFILGPLLNNITEYVFEDTTKKCTCHTANILTDYSFIGFVLGCTIKDLIIQGGSTENYQYILLFGVVENFEISFCENFTLDYPPQKLEISSSFSGSFLLATSEYFNIKKSASFYSSHLTLFKGVLTNSSIYIYPIPCSYSQLFELNYYYLTDYEIVHDPLFNVFYLYTLDYYFGLRIISVSADDLCGARYTQPMPGIGFALSICGQMMHIVLQNTDLIIYFMDSWASPKFHSSIPAFTQSFKTVQGTLRCSSQTFAQYLFWQMKNSTNDTFLHIVDLLANDMSNTVNIHEILNSSNSKPVYAEFLNSSGYLVCITDNLEQQFFISPFQLVIDTTGKCQAEHDHEFLIYVVNALGASKDAQFSLTVEEYSQGSVKSNTIEIWQLALMCVGAFILSILMFLCIKKKCLRHKTRVKTEGLFDFQNEFVQIETLYATSHTFNINNSTSFS